MHRLIDPRTHGFIDYAVVAVLLLGPMVLGFGGTPAILSYVLGAAYLGLSLLTAYPLGAAKVVPFPLHGFIELGAGVLAIVSPWLFGFSELADARWFFLVAGISVVGLWSLTNYRAAETTRAAGANRAFHRRTV